MQSKPRLPLDSGCMFFPIEGGSTENIQGYVCQLPPVGYGKNRLTGELEYIGVIKASAEKRKQKWKRIALPDDWDKRCAAETRKQENDSEYYDPELEKIRLQHWQYRLCGLWLKINGEDVYISPSHYMYLNWCPLDVGYPSYRNPDRQFFYVWELCCEDPRCGGLVDIERRRQGKTYKMGSILLDRTSLARNHHAGIQSKTFPDAKQLFQKTVVTFFKKWPTFFKPVYDTSKGTTPTMELRFFQPNRRGRKALQLTDTEELESWIDIGSSEIFHYDGSKLNTYGCDEFGKAIEVNVWDRWNVVRFCLDQDGAWVGKALFTSTIEEMENGGENARYIWDASDPKQRDENGRTKSGMYRFFLPAYETTLFDEFGMPKREEAKVYYINQRKGLESDPRALSSIIRKNPFTIEEAFRIDGDRCLWDAMKLNDQLGRLESMINVTERGNFVWENGIPFTRVKWEKSKTGRFEICWLFTREEEANMVIKQGNKFSPNNYRRFVIGVDPFKYDEVKDNRRSDCAAFCYKKFDVLDQNDPYNETFVAMYHYRAATTSMQYEDLLKMAWYFGAQILFERNIDNWKEFYTARNCEDFLMKLPGEDDYGIYCDGHKLVHQQLADYTEAFIDTRIQRVFFKPLIRDWLEFDIGHTTRYDLTMGAGYTLIAAHARLYKHATKVPRDVTEFFPLYKAS